jgi:hypothetical protein
MHVAKHSSRASTFSLGRTVNSFATLQDGVEDFGYFALFKAKKGDVALQEVLAKVTTAGDLKKHISGSAADLDLMMAQRSAVAAVLCDRDDGSL